MDSKAKTHARLAQAAGLHLRGRVHVHAQALEHLGAAPPCPAAIAVLGDCHLGRGGAGRDQRRECADVECLGGSACPAGVQERDTLLGELLPINRHGRHVCAHGLSRAQDLIGGGGASRDHGEGRRDLRRIERSLQQLLKEPAGVVDGQCVTSHERFERLFDWNGTHPCSVGG